MARWEKTWSIGFEASHHDAQKWRITGEAPLTASSSSAFDLMSFTAESMAEEREERGEVAGLGEGDEERGEE